MPIDDQFLIIFFNYIGWVGFHSLSNNSYCAMTFSSSSYSSSEVRLCEPSNPIVSSSVKCSVIVTKWHISHESTVKVMICTPKWFKIHWVLIVLRE